MNTESPEILLSHYLNKLKLPAYKREYQKLARLCHQSRVAMEGRAEKYGPYKTLHNRFFHWSLMVRSTASSPDLQAKGRKLHRWFEMDFCRVLQPRSSDRGRFNRLMSFLKCHAFQHETIAKPLA